LELLEEKYAMLAAAREAAANCRSNCYTLLQMMKRPDFSLAQIPESLAMAIRPEIWRLLEIEMKYDGYIRRQDDQLRAIFSSEAARIPDEFDYAKVSGLRKEARQKLCQIRPATLGQAGRISGVTPCDLGVLSVWLKRFPQK
jgi:tRNA uridine 5-carboxymethylaminomethyl modification enzyme